jgi:hypothetical protein
MSESFRIKWIRDYARPYGIRVDSMSVAELSLIYRQVLKYYVYQAMIGNKRILYDKMEDIITGKRIDHLILPNRRQKMFLDRLSISARNKRTVVNNIVEYVNHINDDIRIRDSVKRMSLSDDEIDTIYRLAEEYVFRVISFTLRNKVLSNKDAVKKGLPTNIMIKSRDITEGARESDGGSLNELYDELDYVYN